MADVKKFLDAEGVKHLWSKVNMQDYPNNETLMAVINAIDETKADKSELFSGSWNDLTEKPFEKIVYKNQVIKTQEVSFSNNFGKTTFASYYYKDAGFEDGGEFVVIWDDITYILEPVNAPSGLGVYAGLMLGDINFTTAPFQIVAVKPDPPCSYEVYIYTNDGVSPHNIEVYKTKEYIKYLDEEVIPSTIARISDIPEAPVTSVNNMIGDVVIDIPTLDATLSIEGQAADAKAVGDAINAPKVELILISSTEGSTKQFKLTINDDGILTATEIVDEE